MICGQCGTFKASSVGELRGHWRDRQATACAATADWGRVADLRRKGEDDAADRLVRKLLGIKGAPMPEEIKEQLRQYQREHRQEQYARKKLKRLEVRLAKRRLQGSTVLRRA